METKVETPKAEVVTAPVDDKQDKASKGSKGSKASPPVKRSDLAVLPFTPAEVGKQFAGIKGLKVTKFGQMVTRTKDGKKMQVASTTMSFAEGKLEDFAGKDAAEKRVSRQKARDGMFKGAVAVITAAKERKYSVSRFAMGLQGAIAMRLVPPTKQTAALRYSAVSSIPVNVLLRLEKQYAPKEVKAELEA